MTYKHYFSYILANKKMGTLYVGMTNDLIKRIWEHKEGKIKGFTQKYAVKKLVYFETFEEPLEAIQREKQLKAGSRKKKINLIESMNPNWDDLSKSLDP